MNPRPRISIASVLLRLLSAILGICGGLLLLEAVLRVNPPLLAGLRGLGAPAPLDPPLTVSAYDVRYSDADEIYWRPDWIRPIPPGADLLEARVVLATDELGFRNPAPLPAKADVVVLGRSYSLGAQNAAPWPALLAVSTGRAVINLSEPGSSPTVKREYLDRYGLPRDPAWVVVEVSPPLDAVNYVPADPWLIQLLPVPLAQEYLRRLLGASAGSASGPIYPLPVDLPGRTLQLTCCIHYLDTLTLTAADWQASRGWRAFTAEIDRIADDARRSGARTAVLYAPTKPEIYFPLALEPAQLEPALRGLVPLRVDPDGGIVPDPGRRADVLRLRANAQAARDALAAYARARGLVFIDPTALFAGSVLAGNDPFMVYDSHWNDRGHALVAQAVREALAAAEVR
jgi:hypothetical protein